MIILKTDLPHFENSIISNFELFYSVKHYYFVLDTEVTNVTSARSYSSSSRPEETRGREGEE